MAAAEDAVQVAPFGSWTSPVTPELIVSAAVGLGDVWVDGDASWWSELRPAEGGRVVIVRDGVDLLAAPWSARTRVHEYGGGAWWLGPDAALYFAHWGDQRLYRLPPGSTEPVALTPEPPVAHGLRYADGRVSADGRWIVCVRERHDDAAAEAVNEVVVLPADGSAEPVAVASGADFYAAPRLSADGRWLCWLQWDHPRMPWDGTELWVARFDDGVVHHARRVAGGAEESIVQPEWAPGGRLTFCSDRNNFWTLYHLEVDAEGGPVGFPVALPGPEADIGLPAWVFGRSRYGFLPDGRIVAAFGADGHVHLAVIDCVAHTMITTETSLATFEALRVRGERVVGVGGGFLSEPAVVELTLPGDGGAVAVRAIRPPRDLGLDPGDLSAPEPLRFTSASGRTAHAWYYPPRNRSFTAPEGDRPPLLVLSHGGPTASANPGLNLSVQFWTSRGFAVVDVDYGGSTGYGRAYRQLLNGRWGIVDVEDCCAAAEFLVERGAADPDRLAIRGGSAGGFTTLAALAFRETFRAGASHFGVADLSALAADTHKFESRYLDGLVGPWPADEATYRQRSPIHHTDRLSCPIILFQGLEDVIVPPAQSRMMAEALAAKGIPHAYLEFEGEQHGFRKAENIMRTLTAELYFYGRVFGFEPAGAIEPVDIVLGDRL